MNIPTSRFPRLAYARQVAAIAAELHNWSRLASTASYGNRINPQERRRLDKLDDRSASLADIAEELERLAMAIRATP